MKFKRGDSFSFAVTIKENTDDGLKPLIVDVDNIRCQVRTVGGNYVDDLIIETTDIEGEYKFSSEDTSKYPIETLETDIEINDEGIINSSQTFKIQVEKDITRIED